MVNSKTKVKVAVVGAGTVGSTIAYSIMLSDIASEIVLIDVNKDKARGEAMDMNHGKSFVKQIQIKAGEYGDCSDADVIVITAGIARKPGQTRLDLAKTNVKILKSIVDNIVKYTKDAIILVVSNPVDILTYFARKFSGFPANKVFGTGTSLDTARFRYLISEYCGVDVTNVHAYIIGEHGDSEVPVWSITNIAGKKFENFFAPDSMEKKIAEMERIYNEVKTAGATTISLKGATNYGISLAVTRILKAILRNENSIIPVTSVINGNYGINNVALSLPAIINSNGINSIYELNLDENEINKLRNSADKLKSVIEQINI